VIIRARCVLVLATALAVVPAATANTFEVAVGDTIDISGTDVACLIVSGNSKGINCFLATHRGVIASTYGIELYELGAASVNQVNATGTGARQIWKRTVASARTRTRAGLYYQANLGDSFWFTIKGGFLGCKVIDVTTGSPKFQGRKIECFRTTQTTAFPNTYGVVLSNKFAGSFHFDANGKPAADSFVRFQPKG
jgi:hypothetical protein